MKCIRLWLKTESLGPEWEKLKSFFILLGSWLLTNLKYNFRQLTLKISSTFNNFSLLNIGSVWARKWDLVIILTAFFWSLNMDLFSQNSEFVFT